MAPFFVVFKRKQNFENNLGAILRTIRKIKIKIIGLIKLIISPFIKKKSVRT